MEVLHLFTLCLPPPGVFGSPRGALTPGGSSAVSYRPVQLKGCEILALTLGQGVEDGNNLHPHFTLGM